MVKSAGGIMRQREPNLPVWQLIQRLKSEGFTVARSKTGGFNIHKPGNSIHFQDVESLQEFSSKVAPKAEKS
jgi:hypothetical protein